MTKQITVYTETVIFSNWNSMKERKVNTMDFIQSQFDPIKNILT
jgi:hypothetical protein